MPGTEFPTGSVGVGHLIFPLLLVLMSHVYLRNAFKNENSKTYQVIVTNPKGIRETDADLCLEATRVREGEVALY